MSEPTPQEITNMPFEAALAELERIVQKLESGDVALEESISIYERGAALRAHCEAKLKDAQAKVEKIMLGEDGKISTAPANLDAR